MKRVEYACGEQDNFYYFPGGRVERVSGRLRFIWLGVCLIFRGYQLHPKDSSNGA
jgi:hypothetical protein